MGLKEANHCLLEKFETSFVGEPAADAKICVDIFVLLRAFGFCRLCSPAKLCCFIGVNIILIIDFIALTASAGF